jgi:hypothetical protein
MPEQEPSAVGYVRFGAMKPGVPQVPEVPSQAGQP